MHSRFSTPHDIDFIKNIISSNNTMYGIDITQQHNIIIDRYVGIINNHDTNNIAIVYEENNMIFGCVTQHLWAEMPFWSAGLLFINPEIVRTALMTKTVEICHDMLDFLLYNAEKNKYFDYMSVVRTGFPNSRDKFLSNKFKTEYHINLLETIEPFGESKFSLHKKLLGFTYRLNSKEVSIRHASKKKELRNPN